MWWVPYIIFRHLWDQSHRSPENTYGIDPIAQILIPIGIHKGLFTNVHFVLQYLIHHPNVLNACRFNMQVGGVGWQTALILNVLIQHSVVCWLFLFRQIFYWIIIIPFSCACATKLEHSYVYPSFNLVFYFCVNILLFFVENGNINIRDELRNFSQQPNF